MCGEGDSSQALDALHAALSYERASLNGAYETLFSLLDRARRPPGVPPSPPEDAAGGVSSLLHALSALLRLLSDRLRRHLCASAASFAQRVVSGTSSAAAVALHDSLQHALRAAPRPVFGVSAHYDGAARAEVLRLLLHVLRRPALLVPPGDEDAAARFGCVALVSPAPGGRRMTREQLSQYADRRAPSPEDGELRALLRRLDAAAQCDTPNPTPNPNNPSVEVVPRAVLAGGGAKRVRSRSPSGDPPPSQVVRYRRPSPPRPDAADAEPRRWVFQISNSLRAARGDIARAVRRLGACVDRSPRYSPRTTHLVVADGAAERTEKYLSCCAAGRRIVPPRYVFDSARRGRWMVGRLPEYDMNPIRRRKQTAPFRAWRVVLFASSRVVADGIEAVLRAGECAQHAAYVFAAEEGETAVDAERIAGASHLLVECREPSVDGRFAAPTWMPREVLRAPENAARLFTLELLYHLLCFAQTEMFDATGRLMEGETVPPACRIDLRECAEETGKPNETQTNPTG